MISLHLPFIKTAFDAKLLKVNAYLFLGVGGIMFNQ
jgi:hypothetical protein